MPGFSLPRLTALTVLAIGLLGCTVSAPVDPLAPESSLSAQEGKLKVPLFAFRAPNSGRILGTVLTNADILKWANASSIQGATAIALDPDPAQPPLSASVTVDKDGHFILAGLRDSRPRIFIEVNLNGVRYRASVNAPRGRGDVQVVLDPGSTYLADKLQRAAQDHDAPLDHIDQIKLVQTQQVVSLYMTKDDEQHVLEINKPELNAYAFDHFMDANLPVKVAVYSLAPGVLRGWKPPVPRITPRGSSPSASPSPDASSSPTPPASDPLGVK